MGYKNRKVVAVVLAGGIGKRLGAAIPKQFIEVLGKPLIIYTLEKLYRNPMIDYIVPVCMESYIDFLKQAIADWKVEKILHIVPGGDTFQHSVNEGVRSLEGVCNHGDIVVVHLANFPMTSADIIADAIGVCEKHGNAFSAEPSYLVLCEKTGDGYSMKNIDREYVYGLPSPFAVEYEKIRDICAMSDNPKFSGIEHLPTLMIAAGETLYFSKSSRVNLKITTKEDLDLFEGMLLLEKRHNGEENEAFRVKNAVILAAGGDEMSAKLIYSLPKGLFKVNGVPIIERQIQQIKESGIHEIYLVVGYKKEMYFYLEDKYGVKLLINDKPKKNNVFSLYAAADYLDNTYICNCDNYFTENPFKLYARNSYHATVFKDNTAKEICVTKNTDGRIINTFINGGAGECFYGHAYFNRAFSEKIRRFLREEIHSFKVDSLFWEEFYARHIDELDLYAQNYGDGFIWEFDSIQELQNMDDMFIENISIEVVQRICQILKCGKQDIMNVVISDKGFSNIVIQFSVFGKDYILRYPGEGSERIFTRAKEVIVQKIAAELGIDNTYIYIDETGLKISHFIDNCQDISWCHYKDKEFMDKLVGKLQILHSYKPDEETKRILFYDPIAEADRLISLACKTKGDLLLRFADMRRDIQKLFHYTENDGVEKAICHNDFNGLNVLLSSDAFEIIDWEFAGYCDPAFDFGRVIDKYDLDSPEIDRLLEVYFRRAPSLAERRHWIAYIAIHGWYYMAWAFFKESIGEDTGDWMLYFYHRVKDVLAYVLPLYDKESSPAFETRLDESPPPPATND